MNCPGCSVDIPEDEVWARIDHMVTNHPELVEARRGDVLREDDCPMCGRRMQPEHAHYRCACGYRDSCCQ